MVEAGTIATLASWCEPWNHAFSHSKAIAGTVTGAHIMALFLGGGLAVAADRATLRLDATNPAERARQLREIRETHAPVIAALVVLFATGVLLALADVETFLPSPYFWVKLTLVALLLINGALLSRTERALATAGDLARSTDMDTWRHMRVFAWISVFLWTATAVAGIVLSNAA